MGADDDQTTVTPGISRRRALQVGAALAGGAVVAQGLDLPNAAATPAPVAAEPTATSAAAAKTWTRTEVSFDEGWLFFRGAATGAEATAFADGAWRRLDLPHDWSIEDLPYATSTDGAATADPSTMAFQTTPPPDGTPTVIGPFDQGASVGGKGTGYTVSGIGWYRKHFVLPGRKLAAGMRATVRFEGVFHNATVWVNGVQLTSHLYGYTPFTVDLTPHLVTGSNVIAVKVDNTVPDARWYSGSGIYRHTWLTTTGVVRIADYGVYVTTPSVSKTAATVSVSTDVTNSDSQGASVRVRTTLLDPRGRELTSTTTAAVPLAVGATRTVSVDLPVSKPSLWSQATPSMYAVRTELLYADTVIDTVSTPFGIRTVVWDKDLGLLLNGAQVKIKGACLHSGYGPLGAQALGRSVERQVEILAAAGFNSIRTAHNPPTPHLLDVCDRMGILVWDEAFDHWTGTTFTPDWAADLTRFVKRDRNHPSVIIWSTGNEVSDATFGRQLRDLVAALDPTRPVSQGATPFDSVADPQYQYTDVSDVHYRFTDKEAIRAQYPDKPMTQSESWPATIFEDWQYALDNPWFVGSWVWAGWDYMGESGAGATITASSPDNLPVFGTGPFPWFQDYQGDIDFVGVPKPQNRWRNVVYGNTQIDLLVERPAPEGKQQYANNWSYYDELASWTWDVPLGQPMVVHVYTTGDAVTLTLNGATVATTTVEAADRRVATFTVPYAPGTLKAVATSGGVTLGTSTLTTVGKPGALRLTSDVSALTTGRDDLAHVLVEVLDRQGRLVPDAVTNVKFRVSGAGLLVGVGNGNPHNLDSFQRPSRYTWHGRCLAVLRPAKKAGTLSLTATAAGLTADRIDLPVTA